jgi:hypothetical protein
MASMASLFRRAAPAAEAETPDKHIGRLNRAIGNARRLLAFSVESEKKLEPKIIDGIVISIAKLGVLKDGAQLPPPEAEKEFWQAYEELTAVARPVSAHSIGASGKLIGNTFGPTAYYSLLAMIVFLGVVSLQGYWFIGNDLRREQRTIEKEIDQRELRYRELSAQLRSLEDEASTLEFADLRRVRNNDPRRLEVDKRLTEIRVQLAPKYRETDRFAGELDALRRKREPLVDLLHGWYTLFQSSGQNAITKERIEAKRKELTAQSEALRRLEQARLISVAADGMEARRVRQEIDDTRSKISRDRAQLARDWDFYVVDLTHRVDLSLDVVERFATPVLLGMLGALIYILRSLITQIREYSYTADFFSLTFVRICLGMMAGLFGTLFVPAAPADAAAATGLGFKDIPPLALPLLFGYAVEVLFTFMDRFVRAFTESKAP